MNTYIILGNWTDQGVREIKNSPARLDAAKTLMKGLGGELKSFYLTMGSFDMVVVAELPDDAAAARGALRIASGGAARTITIKAFPEQEYRQIIASLG